MNANLTTNPQCNQPAISRKYRGYTITIYPSGYITVTDPDAQRLTTIQGKTYHAEAAARRAIDADAAADARKHAHRSRRQAASYPSESGQAAVILLACAAGLILIGLVLVGILTLAGYPPTLPVLF